MLTQNLLHELFSYDPITGDLVWNSRPVSHFPSEAAQKTWNTRFAKTLAGSIHNRFRYRIIRINKIPYRSARIIWLYQTGHNPTKGEYIDHIDHNHLNDAWANLRLITHQENMRNLPKKYTNKSGHTGIFYRKEESRYQVTIANTYVGSTKNLEEAIQMRKKAEQAYNFHPNHGK